MRETEASVDHQTALHVRVVQFVLVTDEVATMCPQQALEPVLLEKYLAKSFLYRGEVKIRFSEDEFQIAGVQLEAVFSEKIVPHCFLMIPIDEVTLLEWQLLKPSQTLLYTSINQSIRGIGG